MPEIQDGMPLGVAPDDDILPPINQFLDTIKTERNRLKTIKRAKKYCKNILKFFFSTAGLLIINVGYMVAGAYIFSHLEQLNEQTSCLNAANDYQIAENLTVGVMMDIAYELDGVTELTTEQQAKITKTFQDYLQQFALSAIDAQYNTSVDCNQLGKPGGTDFKFSFTGSLVFSITVITTIGYGHIAPKTKWGRMVCIAYAIIGLPLFMLCLANIGEVLANLFRLIYSSLCCCGCCKNTRVLRSTETEEEREQLQLEKVAHMWRIDPVSGRPIPPEDQGEEEENLEGNEEDGEESVLTVPLTISLMILLGFIFMGTGLFMFFEDYSFTDATYYSFTTVSTIGFGDLVPDTSLSSSNGVAKAVVVILYITIGMAALSMCVQMMLDETAAKFVWIGEKLGLSKQQDEIDDFENSTTETST